jgi:uncharacterized protein (TIGR02271 family)
MVIPVVEEELSIETQRVERGRIRVHTRVESREEVVDAAVTREEVVVEHVPVDKIVEGKVPVTRHENGVLIIPLLEEVLVVEKRLILREEVHVFTRSTTTSNPQTVVLRREFVDVEREEPRGGNPYEDRNLFDDQTEAQRVYTALVHDGYAKADLDILTNDDKDDEPKLAHMRDWVPEPDVDIYLAGVDHGGTVITANVADSAVSRAAGIMSGFKMVNIKQRAVELKKTNAGLTLSDPAKSDNVLEVVEEELQVGKETVVRGRMRIYSYVTEREVKQDVKLRDETLKVQRRPVNRPVTVDPDLFKSRSYEMVEVDEIAKVGKTARVIEEVSLGKEVAEKVETIKETLRRQDVQVEEIPAVRAVAEYGTDFRDFYDKNLSKSGVTYEKLEPAFHYGYNLATREPFRSNPWTAVEADSRRIWEEKNPGTWEQNKAVIKYAWEKVRAAR